MEGEYYHLATRKNAGSDRQIVGCKHPMCTGNKNNMGRGIEKTF